MSAPAPHAHSPRSRKDLAKLALGALGVVYGDIGTSPLYAVKECFDPAHQIALDEANILGVLSLIFWALTLVVVLKYLTFIMRADNNGEGGILALLALVAHKRAGRIGLVMMGLFGAALLYGDGIITPAISVLSAVEGLKVAVQMPDVTILGVTLGEQHYIVAITVVILIALFAIQRRGTGGIGAVFGPTMAVWFLVIGALGFRWILHRPSVLKAVYPGYAVQFFAQHGGHGFLILAAVVLCITGGEALYADMGHFGRVPIRAAWYVGVFPALLLNYFGQGALLLERGDAVRENPFFAMVDGWLQYPLVIIATFATVIASQALISGAFSLTQQAVQLGYWPRVGIVHTSGKEMGQIYVPEINTLLMISCLALVLWARSSSKLAAAYGIAVTGTMSITSILFYEVAREKWRWSVGRAGALTVLFLVVDLAFFGANFTKIHEGGFIPLTMAAAIFILMTTWKRGRALLAEQFRSMTLPLGLFMDDLANRKPVRVQGLAVFMTSNPDGAPPVLLHHFKHNKVLHEQVVLLSIGTEPVPEIPPDKRVEVKDIGQGFYQVRAHYGFMETPNVLEVLEACADKGIAARPGDTSYFLGRETLILDPRRRGMARWRKILFSYLSRNARPANAFFHIPPNRVVELGTQIEL